MAQDTKQLFTKLHNYMQVHSIPGMPGGNQSRIESMTYNPRYPGFDEANYRKLESKVDALGLVGNERQKAMDQLYVQVLPNVQNQILNSNRREYINDAAYEVSQIQDKSAKAQAKSKFTVTELAQQLKEKFDIDPTANDEDVFDSRIQSIPNGGQLLADYMNDGNPQLLYQGGLESVPEDARQKLKDNFWDSLWDNIKTKANVPIDNIKKWGQRTLNDLGANIYKNMLKRTLGDALPEKMGINIDNYVNTIDERAITPTVQKNIANYQNKINQAYAAKEQKNLDQDIKNYYDQKGYTEMLKEGDFRGFLFKGMGDAAQNWEMPVVVAASIFQPEVGMALMTTDAYARENQEAFENMMNNGATYEEAEQGAVAVGLVNAAVEVTLEKLIGGVETSASNAIRKTMLKNVQEEAAKKGLGRILLEGAGTQLRASGEEGLEEIVQQIVQNAAVKTVNENQDLFEGVGAAFEGGFYNPMNLLAGGGNLTQNVNQNKDVVRQQIMDGAYNAGKAARTVTDMFKGTPAKSKNVWQKVVETSTRSIPEKVVENELRLTPTERKNVERYGITPANFVLKENIAGLSNADKVVALQDISSDAYNNVTNIFKNVIPQDYRTESKTAGKMLQTMIDTMEKSDIVKEEYADYITKLKEMLDYSDFSPYEKLAIRRDFDAIVGNDIFGANGRVKGLEDQTIAKWRADLNEEINQLGDEFGIDVKSENARIANAITIRDGLLRALSQNKKNNAIGLQDLGIGAILSAGNPVQAGGIIIAKRLLENAAGNIAQGLYNTNNTPLTPANTKRGAGFIQRPGTNANNNFMISATSSNNSINPQEELSTATEFVATPQDIDYQSLAEMENETPQDIDYQTLAELENVTNQDIDYQELAELENETDQMDYEDEGTTTPKKKTTKKETSKKQTKKGNITKGMDEAAKRYVSGEGMRINDYLRDGTDYGELSKDEQTLLSDLDKLTNSDTVKQNKLYRSSSLDSLLGRMNDDTYENILNYVYGDPASETIKNIVRDGKGKVLEEKGFLSATKDKQIADDRHNFSEGRHQVTVEIEIPEGMKGKDLEAYDIESDPQKEVLLPRGTKYEIIDIIPNDPDAGGILVKARIVNDGGLDKNQASSKTATIDENEIQQTNEGQILDATFETLPDTVTVTQEEKETGPKRIAPDRVPRQQLTYDRGVKNIADNIKTIAEYLKVGEEFFTQGNYNDGDMKRKYNELRDATQQILYGNKGLRYKSNKSAEFVELMKNIKDNKNNERALEEVAKTYYISKVKKDISKGYMYPQEVLDKIPGAKKAVNNRERYQKGLDTSFSAKDARIDYSEQDKIGAGIKSQDGKQVTKEQKENIVKGIIDFQDVFGIDMKKVAEELGFVYVDLHGGSVFLSDAAGMYRRAFDKDGNVKNSSVSVGGSEIIRWKDRKSNKRLTEKVNTTMSHELGHVMDHIPEGNLIRGTELYNMFSKYKRSTDAAYANYLAKDSEVVARAFEQYMDVAKGGDKYYDKVGYWNKTDFNEIVKPTLERAIKEKLGVRELK